MPVSGAALGLAPDRAVRARTAALLIDSVIIGVLSRLLLGGIHDFSTAALGGVLFLFVYFFIQEAADGQTVGKRLAHVKIVQLDGSDPTTRQIAIRNALRLFDALPLLWASGLVAVMWSGPGLRQRMGDRVAGTAVILEPGAKSRPVAGWLLPTLTVVSVLLSVTIYGVLYREHRTPVVGANSLDAAPVPGFPGDNSQVPTLGTYAGYVGASGASRLYANTRGSWTISRSCNGPVCAYAITVKLQNQKDVHSDLTPSPDGWRATFPTHAFRAKCRMTNKTSTVRQREAIVIHFDPGARSAVGRESIAYHDDSCFGTFGGYLDWTAALPTF